MTTAEQTNSSKIREALERAIVWADVDREQGHDVVQREEDLRLALGILRKWREEEEA
jgi:hypothetical protein